MKYRNTIRLLAVLLCALLLLTACSSEDPIPTDPEAGVDTSLESETEAETEAPTVTYTITAQNYGTTPIVATDDAIITDLLMPALDALTATLNGVLLTEGVGYTYNEVTGSFATLPGALTVPAATVTQDPVTGAFEVVPGEAVLVLTGVIAG